MQSTSLTLPLSLVNVHGIHHREGMMVSPIPRFTDNHDTWPLDANVSTLVSTLFIFHFFIFYLLPPPQLCPMPIMMTTAPSLALHDVEDTSCPSICTLTTCPFVSPFVQINLLAYPHACMLISVRRSSPRTTKRPRTGPDRSPGPASVLNGPVLVLNFSGKLRTSPGPVFCPYLIGVVTSHDQALNLVIIPLNPVTTLFN